MSEERIIRAVDRLERAIVRLEQAPPPAPASTEPLAELQQYADGLKARHAALRIRAEEALGRLDGILASEGD